MENTMKCKKKIGILGGSFDPIHQGHLNIAQCAYEEFRLDEVWFIPAGHSPHKDESKMTPATDRAKMVELAISDYPYFRLSMIEIESSETSYTYRTLTKLKEQYPKTKFYFIMGADSFDYLDKWRHPEIIFENAIILVAVRDNLNLSEINNKILDIQKHYKAQIYPIIGGKTDVSSTRLRTDVKDGVAQLPNIPEIVTDYIKKNALYES